MGVTVITPTLKAFVGRKDLPRENTLHPPSEPWSVRPPDPAVSVVQGHGWFDASE